VVLLASIGLTAVAAFDAQRAVRSQQAVIEQALREYATFAAWSYGQHLEAAMASIEREAIGAVNHGTSLHTNPEVPHAWELASYLPFDRECYCHRARAGPDPDSFFALRIGRDWLEVGRSDHEDPPRYSAESPRPEAPPDLARPAYSTADRRWLLDSLTRRIRGAGGPDHGYTLVVDAAAAEPRILLYTLMPTSRGDTMVYGARYAPAAFSQVLSGILDMPGLLPTNFTAGRRNRDVLAVRVRDRAGRLLFDSAPGITSPLDAGVTLSDRQASLTVDAVIRPDLAGDLVIGGLPRSHLSFLLGLLGLAAALSIVAVTQLRREGELTRNRADFISSVSHELRTPLAEVRLYSETLRLGRTPSEAEREWALEHIDRGTARLARLVENVLRFSTLGKDDQTVTERANLSTEVPRIVEEFQPLAASQRAVIEMTIAPTPTVELRPDALRRILLNLLENAVKYGPPDQTIRVRTEVLHGEVRLSVTDQGPGVAARERERVWEPYVRGKAASAKGGSGIGLTIVRETARQHGGRAWVETAEPVGARFVVAFPVASPATG
jgi:signal transduction histidine kinase